MSRRSVRALGVWLRCAGLLCALFGLAPACAGADDGAAAPPGPSAQARTNASAEAPSGELRLRGERRTANDAGPLMDANRAVPGIAPQVWRSATAEAELRTTWRAPATDMARLAFTADALVEVEHRELDAARSTRRGARLNEAYAAADFGELGVWQASAGKRVVAWDIGHGFRPNDLVQQEARRTLLALPQEGRPLVEVERYAAQSAAALVWVDPQHANAAPDASRGAAESAWAGRAYLREGSADWHVFGRWGRHTHASVGAALAWVAGDQFEVHASARALQRHDSWQFDPQAAGALVGANPWRQATLGRSAQALLGASWTGAQQVSVLAEWWHDGTALADRDWDAWRLRNDALDALTRQAGTQPNVVRAAAGNLAWQATPLASNNLRRDNAFVRLAWQPARWVLSLDALVTPSDRGHVVTASLQWQGEQLRINAAWRVYGGPAAALFAQLPQRDTRIVSIAWPF